MPASVLGFVLLYVAEAVGGDGQSPLDIRVGIVAYQDFQRELGRLEGLLTHCYGVTK